ncbi:hypothetical protein HT102_01525 [Hoyosella sp. G463]|uniref:Teichuronopeptide biosynthesis TupA-like protein n=1 Tax=Lolliginicoccus lacisalsi TaxID=2742202 RepID=A0A927JA79_9ACTN|nr:ATP-grasp fold amidoligase family protein [Lolliginicoccus lacisalsi]MBD8505170.1 hypothetical protein [Lolliginicoccus lacisalsi]
MISTATRCLAQAHLAVVRAMPVTARRSYGYLLAMGRPPRLRHPRTFTEKVNWRILRDRRELLAGTCDKLRMKELAWQSAGDLVRVPRTLWSGRDLRELAGIALPHRWVLKPNHRSSGIVILGEGAPDIDDLVARTQGWLENPSWELGGEWAYSHARPMFIIEELIGDGSSPPCDFKFFVFDGVPRLVMTSVDAGRTINTYTPDWKPFDICARKKLGAPMPRPDSLDRMLAIAARIGGPFDFLRVDLYDHDGVVWFGETTPYPGSGMSDYSPRGKADAEIGSWWTLPDLALHEARRAS